MGNQLTIIQVQHFYKQLTLIYSSATKLHNQ